MTKIIGQAAINVAWVCPNGGVSKTPHEIPQSTIHIISRPPNAQVINIAFKTGCTCREGVHIVTGSLQLEGGQVL